MGAAVPPFYLDRMMVVETPKLLGYQLHQQPINSQAIGALHSQNAVLATGTRTPLLLGVRSVLLCGKMLVPSSSFFRKHLMLPKSCGENLRDFEPDKKASMDL